MLSRDDLHDYQNRAIAFVKEKRKCNLFLSMGMGKTSASLTAAADLLQTGKVKRVLIIAPLRVANTVWSQEACKWEHLSFLQISVATGSSSDRKNKLSDDAHIHVINRENIPWLIQYHKWRWDMVIVDESSSFKNHASKRFRALKAVTKYVKYHINLTGTPSPNGLQDLWSQMYLIDQGARLGRNITAFRNNYMRQTGFGGYVYEMLPDKTGEIQDRISDVSLSMEASDYLTLPNRIDSVEYVVLPDKIKKQYKDLEKEFLLAINNNEIIALSSSSLANKLTQYCNGAVYDEEGKTHIVHDEKINALKDIIDDNKGENILVAYNFKSDLKRLKQAFPRARVLDKNNQTIEDWNNGDISLLLAHPASAGHGVNLQYGGNTVIWFGMNWSLELYQQFNARLHRQGQVKPTSIIHLLAKGCIDEKIYKSLGNKTITQQSLIDFLKH